MLRFFVRRFAVAVLVALTVLTLAFMLTRVSGDLAISIAGPNVTGSFTSGDLCVGGAAETGWHIAQPARQYNATASVGWAPPTQSFTVRRWFC